MTFEAYVLHRLSSQHARISRPVRFMASSAAFKAHRSVLKSKRTALVSVAGEAARLIAGKCSGHFRPDAPVGVVTVHATHCFLGKPVVVRLLELRRNLKVTTRALLVDPHNLAHYQSVWPIFVDCVARCARDRVFGVAALQASNVGRLVQMATEANAICRGGSELRRVADGRRIPRLGVFLAGAVAGLAGMSCRTPFLVCIDQMVRTLREGSCNVFVAQPARIRSGIGRGWLRPCMVRSQSDPY